MKIELKDPTEFQKLLLVNGYSQRSFAKKLKLSSPYVNQIINGKRSPSGKVAKDMADCLKVDFESIFFIKDAC